MGNSISTPERLYRAVKNNNVVELQDLLNQLHRQGQLDPVTRRRYLEYKDAEGRTPLLLASSKNAYHIVGMLLANGADITYMRKFNTGGTALHEAAAQNHEALVELLLQHGAEALGHPFLENYAKRTPIDLAVTEGHVNIVRRLEKCGLFCGYVAVKVPTLMPFGKSWKSRWCVVMRRFSGPGAEGRGEDCELWYYKDTASCMPLCKVSMAGSESSVSESGAGWEASLKLRPGVPKPTDAAVQRQGNSWVIQFRPVSSPVDVPINRNTNHAPNVVPEDAFFNLLRACSAHRPGSQPPGQAPTLAQIPHTPANNAHARPPPGGPYQPGPVSPAQAGSIPPPPALASSAGPLTAGMDRMEAMPGETDEQFAARLASLLLGNHALSTPPPSPPATPTPYTPNPTFTTPPQQPRPFPRNQNMPANGGPQTPVTGGSQNHASGGVQNPFAMDPFTGQVAQNSSPTPRPSNGPSVFAAAPAADPGPPNMLSSLLGFGAAIPGVINSVASSVTNTIGQALTGGGSGPQPTHPAPGPSTSSSTSTPIIPPPPTPTSTQPTPTSPVYTIPPMPMTQNRPDPNPSPSQFSPLPPYPSLDCLQSFPSAPSVNRMGSLPSAPSLPLEDCTSAASQGGGSSANEDEGLCVICLVNNKEAGFLHGNSVHRCVCNECAVHIKVGDACPMCRQPVERVLGVF